MFIKKVFIMSTQLSAAILVGALMAASAPAIGLASETPATLQVEAEGPSIWDKAKAIAGKTIESGKEKIAMMRDPDEQVRQLRFENEELKRRLFQSEKAQYDRKVMQALDYNRAMMCLENIGAVLEGYKPTILNPAPPLVPATVPTDEANPAATEEVTQ